MKIIALALIAFFIFLSLIIFTVLIYSINLEMNSKFPECIGGGTIDPTLPPCYAPYYYQALQFNSLFVAGPIILGVISLAFLVPNIILRMKKIPTRKYMFIIAAGILFFFGFSSISNGLQSLLTLEYLDGENYSIVLVGGLITMGYGAIFVIPGIIALKKAKLRIKN